MCGICGIIGFNDTEQARSAVRKMNNVLRHRGPDDEGIWISESPPLAFGHRRLAIIDLSQKASQPFISHDGRFIITYNGEVYNYRELREKCSENGSIFKSQSDTEVIIECYRHWGCNAFKEFKGMWAFALFDKSTESLIFCRDPFGIKPLYYGTKDGVLFFASEPKALRAIDEHLSKTDEATVTLFQDFGYIERGPWTFYEHVKRFPSAHYARLDLSNVSSDIHPVAYWHPPRRTVRLGRDEAARELERLLIQSMRIHLRSDVPLGSCLSGGIDSSAIVSIGSNLQKDLGRFNTFTTCYPDHGDIDETFWAQKVIDYTGSIAHYAKPTLDSFISDFDNLLYSQDEPFGSTSIYAQYAVFKKISSTAIKVVLDGQGADEVFAGYHGLLNLYVSYLLKKGSLMAFLRESFSIAELYRKALHTQYYETMQFYKNRLRLTYRRLRTIADKIRPHTADEVEHRLKILNPLQQDFEEYLVHMVMQSNLPELLRYEDRNSMAFSIESRVPFLEPELVHFALSLPAEYKIHNGVTKHILRESLKGYIPEDVRTRVDKLGFPAPEKQWLARAFGIEVDQSGSLQWRKLVVKRWRRMAETSI